MRIFILINQLLEHEFADAVPTLPGEYPETDKLQAASPPIALRSNGEVVR
ncbi:MAG: hypothetical protein KME16_13580 [Scytolyngbya sp. HA4215-MV1]|nr:hypothetical protein [Scytolyngbya sp. HA4215-MV1]